MKKHRNNTKKFKNTNKNNTHSFPLWPDYLSSSFNNQI